MNLLGRHQLIDSEGDFRLFPVSDAHPWTATGQGVIMDGDKVLSYAPHSEGVWIPLPWCDFDHFWVILVQGTGVIEEVFSSVRLLLLLRLGGLRVRYLWRVVAPPPLLRAGAVGLGDAPLGAGRLGGLVGHLVTSGVEGGVGLLKYCLLGCDFVGLPDPCDKMTPAISVLWAPLCCTNMQSGSTQA